MRKLIALTTQHRKEMVIALAALGIGSASSLAFPLGMGKVMDNIMGEAKVYSQASLTLVVGLLIGVGAAARYVQVKRLGIISEKIVMDIRGRIFQRLLQKDLSYFDKQRSGDLVSRLSNDASVVGRTLTDSVTNGLNRVVVGAGAVGMLFYIAPQMTVMTLVALPIVALGGWSFGRYLRRFSSMVQEALGKSSGYAESRLANVKTVKLFSQEAKEVARYEGKVQEVFALAKKEAQIRAAFFSTMGMSVNMLLVGVLFYGSHLVKTGVMTYGDLSSFLIYASYVAQSIANGASSYSEFMKGLGASDRVFEILEAEDSRGAQGRSLPSPKGRISFKDVSFTYPSRVDVEVLAGLDFEVEEGESVAVVGKSGSGKSTILQLLTKLYAPTKGKIAIDGVDIAALKDREVRKMIGVVPQEISLLDGSILSNISYGEMGEEVDMEKVIHAAKMANAHEFICAFPDGYETEVGDRGISLSGGQRQRISIARALYLNPPILFMDEATSALDGQSERLVQDALKTLMAGRTTIVVAHRLSTIQSAGRIIVLDGGKVVESGKHEELLAKQGAYARIIHSKMEDK